MTVWAAKVLSGLGCGGRGRACTALLPLAWPPAAARGRVGIRRVSQRFGLGEWTADPFEPYPPFPGFAPAPLTSVPFAENFRDFEVLAIPIKTYRIAGNFNMI
jgi:hypothetical protein